jgi:hypothetical protein
MDVSTLGRSRNAAKQMAIYFVTRASHNRKSTGEKAKRTVNMRMAELGPLDGALFNA